MDKRKLAILKQIKIWRILQEGGTHFRIWSKRHCSRTRRERRLKMCSQTDQAKTLDFNLFEYIFYSVVFLFSVLLCSCLTAQDIAAFSQSEYCAFCDSTVLEKQKFFEDDLVIALYTHKPIFPGHCLIIPKRHVKRFEDLSNAEANQIIQVINKVHRAVHNTFYASSYLLLQKNGREVGQTVFHVHFHYIPRPTGEISTLKFMFKMYIASLKKPMDSQAIEKIVLKLREAMECSN